jgi:hypothetical protein
MRLYKSSLDFGEIYIRVLRGDGIVASTCSQIILKEKEREREREKM